MDDFAGEWYWPSADPSADFDFRLCDIALRMDDPQRGPLVTRLRDDNGVAFTPQGGRYPYEPVDGDWAELHRLCAIAAENPGAEVSNPYDRQPFRWRPVPRVCTAALFAERV